MPAARITKAEVLAHPLFGKEDKIAPCSHRELARILNCSDGYIARLRIEEGVIPVYVASEPSLSRADADAYAICKLVANAWKRPVGMDALLNEIKNA